MAFPSDDALTDFAPAKVNLTLRVLGRRADGYHELESLVAFADAGDRLAFVPGEALGLEVAGSTAASAGPSEDNLVLKAARNLAARVEGLLLGRFVLEKELPVAAGLGGGSSDAAAALRLLARVNAIALDDPRLHAAAAATGADVPVCLDPRPRIMRGIGEVLSAPLPLAPLPAVLVNPRVPVPTRDVFSALRLGDGLRPASPDPRDEAGLAALIADGENDLEAPALGVQPVIAEVLSALRALRGVTLARMSGSGATCFALFESRGAADAGAQRLAATQPGWWVRATILGSYRSGLLNGS